MISCPSCQAEQADTSVFCSACGTALKPEYAATVLHKAGNNVSSSSPGDSLHGRFLPGTKVADRYRIVSLVGKGGMGEVYRADDLKLGHTVALKFLPKNLADDPKRLEYFHNEVRLTRQISHPNVCRVYDIGEADGQHFLSMEYIDGEDLKILLRRIGRLPGDKGIQIAQQLCAGLGAAHDRGVLHRDLKPANIMIDSRGQVRITDFGLAKLADHGSEDEIAGTPAYMAPEQLSRGETSRQSDLYSLGLILFELFTGKAVHETNSVPELLKAHQDSSLSQPSKLVEGIDPMVERVILRCLTKEPSERPKSAHAIAVSLPGADPLAAALAAGETPSPEMVAAAGETGNLSYRKGILCFLAMIFGLILLTFVLTNTQPTVAPNSLDPLRLTIKVQDEILAPLGYFNADHEPKDCIYGFQLNKFGTREWEFWYRQRNDGYLTPVISEITRGPKTYAISMLNPSPLQAGMVSVRTDFYGRLIELLAVPSESNATVSRDHIETMFANAGMVFTDFERVEQPEQFPLDWTPPIYCDELVVYLPKSPESEMRVITGYDQAQLVYFYAGPTQEHRFVDRQFVSPSTLMEKNHRVSYGHLLQLIVLLASIFLTLRNVRLGRADRKGALRFAIWLGTMQLLVWLFGLHHVANLPREWNLLRDYLRVPWLAFFFRHWLYYMALEPYIRRYWPDVLTGWSRALDGRFRDPLFGQQLLIGCMIGVLTWLACSVTDYVAIEQFGVETPIVIRFDVNSLLRLTATLFFVLSLCTGDAVFALMLLFLLRILFRDSRLAVASYALLNVAIFALDDSPGVVLAVVGIWCLGFGFAITRFGLMTGVAFVFAQALLETFPITTEITSWYGRGTLLALAAIVTVSVYGFYTCTFQTASNPLTRSQHRH